MSERRLEADRGLKAGSDDQPTTTAWRRPGISGSLLGDAGAEGGDSLCILLDVGVADLALVVYTDLHQVGGVGDSSRSDPLLAFGRTLKERRPSVAGEGIASCQRSLIRFGVFHPQ